MWIFQVNMRDLNDLGNYCTIVKAVAPIPQEASFMNNGFSWRTEFDICNSTVSKNSYLFYRQQKTFEPCSSIYQHCYFTGKCVEYANKRETLSSPCLNSYNCHPIAFKLLPNGLVMKQYGSLVVYFVSTATWCQTNLLNYSFVSCRRFSPSQEIYSAQSQTISYV